MRLEGPIDLAHSLQGGQAFLWRRDGDRFHGVVRGKVWTFRALPDGSAEATGASRAAFERYLRLLRQDPWETTVAFLTSANNNVLRIEGILRMLVARYGEPIDGGPVRAFPTPERLARATEADLRKAGLGYRAPFLKATAKTISKDRELISSPDRLLELPGVGPKVAGCIALFSLDADDAFPIDRWVLRASEQAFDRTFTPKELAAFASERWGRDAGLAQQYLFHAVRMGDRAPGTARVEEGGMGRKEGGRRDRRGTAPLPASTFPHPSPTSKRLQ